MIKTENFSISTIIANDELFNEEYHKCINEDANLNYKTNHKYGSCYNVLNNLTNWLYNPSFFLDVKNNINMFLNMKFDVIFDGKNILFKDDLNVELYKNEIASYITNEFTYDQVENTVYRSNDSYNKINTQINNWINKKIDKEFRLSSWAINNKTTIYVLMFLFLYLGISSYFTMPRENFPEISETKSLLYKLTS